MRGQFEAVLPLTLHLRYIFNIFSEFHMTHPPLHTHTHAYTHNFKNMSLKENIQYHLLCMFAVLGVGARAAYIPGEHFIAKSYL